MPEMKTMKEMAAETNIPYGTIRRWCLSGQFTGFVKAGNKTLINREKFIEFLNGGSVKDAGVDKTT